MKVQHFMENVPWILKRKQKYDIYRVKEPLRATILKYKRIVNQFVQVIYRETTAINLSFHFPFLHKYSFLSILRY